LDISNDPERLIELLFRAGFKELELSLNRKVTYVLKVKEILQDQILLSEESVVFPKFSLEIC